MWMSDNEDAVIIRDRESSGCWYTIELGRATGFRKAANIGCERRVSGPVTTVRSDPRGLDRLAVDSVS